MNFTKDLLHQILDPKLSANERAQLRCQLARQMELAGNLEAAKDAMGELWRGFGERPDINDLDQPTIAETLLKIGTLTGAIGSTKQIAGSQESAKNLISESLTIFEVLRDVKKVAEAQTELAACYGREGALDNARVMLAQAVSQLTEEDGELYALALLRSAIVEKLSNQINDALNILSKAAALFEAITNHTLRGTFHYEFANLLRRISEIESNYNYLDRAVIEYTAASFHFEQAGHARYQACVENNLALVYLTTNRLQEAHEHLDSAQALFTALKDNVHLAQVEDTRARVMLAEGAISQAEKVARSAVRLLERGGEPILAEALITHGVALLHLGSKDEARANFKRALDVAERTGDLETAGIAALTLFEQLGDNLSNDEICEILDRAHNLLKNSKNASTRTRLTESAFRALSIIHTSRPDWTNFSLEETLHRHEARYIQMALEDADGVRSRAARFLGLGGYQNLQYMLKNTHKELQYVGMPLAEQRSDDNPDEAIVLSASTEPRTVRILHVKDDSTVADIVREFALDQGWELVHFADAVSALDVLATDTPFDLLLVDFELPDFDGLELIKRVRSMVHRRYARILVMSGTLDEAEAREGGADAFLRKPQGLSSIVEMISRLIDESEQTDRKV